MNRSNSANTQFYGSTLTLNTLYQHGVRHVVISPGSRSTPLTMATATHPGLKKHVILDERSAAFFALGIGKATAAPALLICTSGTAVANYFPAIIEASKARVPLIAASADRPARLRGTGANQTIDQRHIFGPYPLFFEEVDFASENKIEHELIRSLSTRAFQVAVGEMGPVHLNFSFKKPLEPTEQFVTETSIENIGNASDTATSADGERSTFSLPSAISGLIEETSKPLFIVGQLPPGISVKPIIQLARQLRAPILSEQGMISSEYAIQGFDGFLRNPDNQDLLNPDLILRYGLQPASKSVLKAIENWNAGHHIYFSISDEVVDVAQTTTRRIEWDGMEFDHESFSVKNSQWLKKWKTAEKTYFNYGAKLFGKKKLTDGDVYNILAPQIPESWFTFFSNSFPVRDQSLFSRFHTPKLFTNRGASGIDGITSTTLGISLALNIPGVLFTGDLAFLHDTNGLLNHRKLTAPLVVAVVNNNGGSIFRMLPISNHKKYFNHYFETPQEADISRLASSYGISHTSVSSPEALQNVQLETLVQNSKTNLHILECRTDAEESMKLRNRLWSFKL